MKIAAFCLLVVIAAFSVDAFDTNWSTILGQVNPGDRLLDRQAGFKQGQRVRAVGASEKANLWEVVDYHYPKLGNGGVISCIKIFDKYLNGTSGVMTVKSGGVGQRNVSILIQAIEGFGMYYNIEIYGKL